MLVLPVNFFYRLFLIGVFSEDMKTRTYCRMFFLLSGIISTVLSENFVLSGLFMDIKIKPRLKNCILLNKENSEVIDLIAQRSLLKQ